MFGIPGAIAGFALTFILNLLKHLPVIGPLIQKYPKIIATVLTGGIGVITAITGHTSGGLIDLLKAIADQLATWSVPAVTAAIATHEVAKQGGVSLAPAKPEPTVTATPKNPLTN